MKFRGSIARPVPSPVNASASPSRVLPHDSGSVWFATPSLCDSFIHYAMPVSRRFRLFSFVPAGTWPRRQHEIVFRLETGDVKMKRSGNNKVAVCLLRPVTLLPAYCRFCFLSLSSSLSLSLSPRTGGGSTMMIPSVGSSIRAEAFALLPGGKGVHTYLISWSG